MIKKNKISYVALSADILHKGHINIIKTASNYGKVIVGLLTDKAISSYRRLPYLNFEQRYEIVKNLKYVYKVVPQYTLDHTNNLLRYKPDYVVHGDDWKKGVLKKTRSQVIKTISKWNGKLIEPKYTRNISSTNIKERIYEIGNTTDVRKERLRRLVDANDIVRIMECHSPLAGLIIEKLKVKKNKLDVEFHGMWSSSLADSTIRGKPDNQSVDYSTRINGLSEILDITTKPIIFDGDNGGRLEHIAYLVRTLERMGVSAISFEDKIGLKQNSLLTNQKKNTQDTIKNFCKKIEKASKIKISDDLMIIARIESLILSKSVNDAFKRAEAYSDAGANMILIHSKATNPNSIFEFSKKFQKSKYYKPIVVVPSTYSQIYEKKLIQNGIKVVIYANQLLRATYPAMLKTAKKILINERSKEAEKDITSIHDIIRLIK